MNHLPANNQQSGEGRGRTWLSLGKGVILAVILSLVLILLLALVLYLTPLPERAAPYLVYGAGVVAILWGSARAARRIGTRGWLNGGLVGVIYVLLMQAGGLIAVEDMTLGWSLAVKLFLGFIFGAVGGMWGVNN